MKVLILSTATGQGHNSAAMAVKESLDCCGCEATVLDVLKIGRKNVSSHVSGLYAGITVHSPGFFRFLYKAGDFVSSDKRRSPIYYLNSLYAHELYDKIKALSPDVIVCPHIFSAQAITYIIEKFGLSVPTVAVSTDYTCIPFWEETRLDYYIIPSGALIGEFSGKGIPEKKLVPIGIPVSSRYKNKIPKNVARKEFSLRDGGHVFAVMGGSMGYGRMKETAEAILARLPDAQVAAVCGKNRRLYETMRLMDNVTALEYIDNVNVLMDAADVLVTKPGGLSSTEAMVKRIPVVFSNPIPGAEEKNALFLSSMGVAEWGKSSVAAADAACRLALDHTAAGRMIAEQEKHIEKDADIKICNFLRRLVKD